MKSSLRSTHSKKSKEFYGASSPDSLAKILLLNQKFKCCPLTKKTISKSEETKLKKGWPIPKIIGHTHFGPLTIELKRKIFCPRLESWELVELIDGFIKKRLQENSTIRVLELCCGSGAIGLSLKHQNPKVELVMSDISKKAFKTAQETAKKHNLEASIYHCDLFSGLPKNQKFDFIVANPPYLDEKIEDKKLAIFEPKQALFAKKNGLALYIKILKKAKQFLNKNGMIFFEISPQVASFFEAKKGWEILRDINQKKRFAFKHF